MRWGEKRYHSLDWELKNRFGEKIYKITLNGGMTCPNRDGRVGTGGCIFCSAHGSGDFAGDASLSVTEQLMQGKADLQKKRPIHSYIAYFQAFTNTYAPVDYLEKIFTEAIRDPDVKILSIATRPDCLGPDVVALLARLNRIKPVWVELGLQTIHPGTTKLIRRGYPLDVFDRAVKDLRAAGIEVIVHVILFLPGETEEMMLQTLDHLNHTDIQGIKLQLLHLRIRTVPCTGYGRIHPSARPVCLRDPPGHCHPQADRRRTEGPAHCTSLDRRQTHSIKQFPQIPERK